VRPVILFASDRTVHAKAVSTASTARFPTCTAPSALPSPFYRRESVETAALLACLRITIIANQSSSPNCHWIDPRGRDDNGRAGAGFARIYLGLP